MKEHLADQKRIASLQLRLLKTRQNFKKKNSQAAGQLSTNQISSINDKCDIDLTDGTVTVTETDRCNNWSDASIFIAQKAVRAWKGGRGCICSTDAVSMKGALSRKNNLALRIFTCCKEWLASALILNVSPRRLVLKSPGFSVSDIIENDDLPIWHQPQSTLS